MTDPHLGVAYSALAQSAPRRELLLAAPINRMEALAKRDKNNLSKSLS